jgi:hypothetical protein
MRRGHSHPMVVSMSPFIRHYLEMVVSMAVGMVAYAIVFRRGMAWTGYRDELVMAVFMTAPMVAWMRYRGHTWRQAAEMTAAMLAPVAVVVVVAVELLGVTGRGLGMASHLSMLLGMLALMLVRRDEYTHSGSCAHDSHHATHTAGPDAHVLPKPIG